MPHWVDEKLTVFPPIPVRARISQIGRGVERKAGPYGVPVRRRRDHLGVINTGQDRGYTGGPS